MPVYIENDWSKLDPPRFMWQIEWLRENGREITIDEFHRVTDFSGPRHPVCWVDGDYGAQMAAIMTSPEDIRTWGCRTDGLNKAFFMVHENALNRINTVWEEG